MKKVAICLSVGVVGMLAMSGGAQAAEWTSCGPAPVDEHSDVQVWVTGGGCAKALSVMKAFNKQNSIFPELKNGYSTSVGRFGCDFDPNRTVVMRCESSPTLILGLDRVLSNPGEWNNPPALTRTLTRKNAARMVTMFQRLDDESEPRKLKLKVHCPTRISRLAFRCKFSYFQGSTYVIGSSLVTKNLHGGSASFNYHAYDRKCLGSGGTLKKCEFPY